MSCDDAHKDRSGLSGSSMDNSPRISIVITTRNRKKELARALESCYRQKYRKFEVLVCDDASTDGTDQMVTSQFPKARLIRTEVHSERLVMRNRAFREALGEFVLTIDDDCYFIDDRTLEGVVHAFESSPGAGVVALPLIEPTREKPRGWRGCQAEPRDELASFMAGAHAIRKSVALEVGGYNEMLVHHQEERDFSLRILDADWSIVYAGTRPLVHTWSPQRDTRRIWMFGIRNTILVLFLNCPLRYLLRNLLGSCVKATVYKLSLRTLPWKLWGMCLGVAACLQNFQARHPVSVATYRKYKHLPKHGPVAGETVTINQSRHGWDEIAT